MADEKQELTKLKARVAHLEQKVQDLTALHNHVSALCVGVNNLIDWIESIEKEVEEHDISHDQTKGS